MKAAQTNGSSWQRFASIRAAFSMFSAWQKAMVSTPAFHSPAISRAAGSISDMYILRTSDCSSTCSRALKYRNTGRTAPPARPVSRCPLTRAPHAGGFGLQRNDCGHKKQDISDSSPIHPATHISPLLHAEIGTYPSLRPKKAIRDPQAGFLTRPHRLARLLGLKANGIVRSAPHHSSGPVGESHPIPFHPASGFTRGFPIFCFSNRIIAQPPRFVKRRADIFYTAAISRPVPSRFPRSRKTFQLHSRSSRADVAAYRWSNP